MKTWIKVLIVVQFLVIVFAVIFGSMYRERALELKAESVRLEERANKIAFEAEKLAAIATKNEIQNIDLKKELETLQIQLKNCK